MSKPKPHGPVSPRLMRHYYGAEKGAAQDHPKASTGELPPDAEVFDTFGNTQDPTKCVAHVWLRAGYFPAKGTKLYARQAIEQAGSEPLTDAARDVLAERRRQVAIGYDQAHDDEHKNGEIANAAADWLMTGQAPRPGSWAERKGVKTRRVQLVIGTAMGIAEIERLDRAAIRQQSAEGGKASKTIVTNGDEVEVVHADGDGVVRRVD